MGSDHTYETFKHAGLTVNILHDDDPPNPRHDYENIGRMLCGHRRYDLGDSGKTLGFTFNPDNFEDAPF